MPAFPQSGTHCFRRNVRSFSSLRPLLHHCASDITRITDGCVRAMPACVFGRDRTRQMRRTTKGTILSWRRVVEFAWWDSKAGSKLSRIELREALLAARSILRVTYPLFLSHDLSISSLTPDIFLSSSLPFPSANQGDSPTSISSPHVGNTSVISVSPHGFSIISRNCRSYWKQERERETDVLIQHSSEKRQRGGEQQDWLRGEIWKSGESRKPVRERQNDEILSTLVASTRLHAREDIGNGNSPLWAMTERTVVNFFPPIPLPISSFVPSAQIRWSDERWPSRCHEEYSRRRRTIFKEIAITSDQFFGRKRQRHREYVFYQNHSK